jgi:hypothetical protein
LVRSYSAELVAYADIRLHSESVDICYWEAVRL